MQFYKGTERGQEAVSEVTKKWKQEGIEEGRKEAIVSMVNKGYLTASQGAEELGISEEELQRIVTGTDPVTKEEQ